MMIIGYIPLERIKEELAYYNVIRRADPYLRMLEVLEPRVKPSPLMSRSHHIIINPADGNSWKRFIVEVVQDYAKSYSIEEV